MKVLILKYALCLRARFAWLLTAFAAWLAASAAWPARLHSFSAAAVLFASLTPVWLDDDTNGFERYAASLPISRAELALSRYALGALCGAAAFVLELAVSAVLRWPLWELYRPALVALYIGCALLSLALPAAYKFGFAARTGGVRTAAARRNRSIRHVAVQLGQDARGSAHCRPGSRRRRRVGLGPQRGDIQEKGVLKIANGVRE